MALDRNYIGSYRLLKLIRAGATCQIWEVISEIDNRRCALKTLQEKFRNDKGEIALLRHEYMVGHRLHHPAVIEIYDFNIAKGIAYLAMEYFESSNLKQWIRQVSDTQQDIAADHDHRQALRRRTRLPARTWLGPSRRQTG